jgi:hypothetical protein
MIGGYPTTSRAARANPIRSGWAAGTTGAVRQILLALLVCTAAATADEPERPPPLAGALGVDTVRIEGAKHVPERALSLLTTRQRSVLTPETPTALRA